MNLVKRSSSNRTVVVRHSWAVIGRRLTRFARWSRAEQRLLFLTILLLPLTTVGMRVLGFKFWYGLLAWSAARIDWRQSSKDETAQVDSLLRVHRTAVRYAPLHNHCLAQSLTLWWLLGCHGLHGDLRIGVRMADGTLRAHAWIDYNGSPPNEGGDVREEFVAFDSALTIARIEAVKWGSVRK